MEIPYYIFGLIYLICLILYGIFLLVNVYHMVRFGHFDFIGQWQTIMVTGVISCIVLFTWIVLQGVDWTEGIPLFDVNTL